jgi:hypothetical protein
LKNKNGPVGNRPSKKTFVNPIITHNQGGVKMALYVSFHLTDRDLDIDFAKGENHESPYYKASPYCVLKLTHDYSEEVSLFISPDQETILAGLEDTEVQAEQAEAV